MKIKKKVTTLHFKFEGEHFTWLLRHLWVEGSETKAINMWQAAFPYLSTTKHMKTLFIDVVSGRKKFAGDSDGPHGFDYVDDDSKNWDAARDGKGNSGFPLLGSWEDVILKKKTQMYVTELEHRLYRMNRKFDAHSEIINALNWQSAAEENQLENETRLKIGQLYSEVINFAYISGVDLQLSLLPLSMTPLPTKRRTGFVGPVDTVGENGIKEGLELADEIWSIVGPVKKYFKDKYKSEIIFTTKRDIEGMCQLPDPKQPSWSNAYSEAKESMIEGKKKHHVAQVAMNTAIETLSLPEAVEHEARSQVNKIMGPQIGPCVDLDKYVDDHIRESKRGAIEAENVHVTEYTSGYITCDGKFYGCLDIDHINFAQDLCEALEIDVENKDAQIILENMGVLTVSCNRFYWKWESIRLTKSQQRTIVDYMLTKGIIDTCFNSMKKMNFQQALEKYDGGV